MGNKRYMPEEIVAKRRQMEVLTGQGRSIAEAVRSIGVSDVTYFRWRAEYGGMKTDQLKRLNTSSEDGLAPSGLKPRHPEVRLVAEAPSCPLLRNPNEGEHDQPDDDQYRRRVLDTGLGCPCVRSTEKG